MSSGGGVGLYHDMILPPPEEEAPQDFKIILKKVVTEGQATSFEFPPEEEEEVKVRIPIWKRKGSYNKEKEGSSI